MLVNELLLLIPDVTIMQGLMSFIGRIVQVVVTILMTHFYLHWRATQVVTTGDIPA